VGIQPDDKRSHTKRVSGPLVVEQQFVELRGENKNKKHWYTHNRKKWVFKVKNDLILLLDISLHKCKASSEALAMHINRTLTYVLTLEALEGPMSTQFYTVI